MRKWFASSQARSGSVYLNEIFFSPRFGICRKGDAMVLRIGLTGAPFAGKTETTCSLVDIPGIIIVPEAATLLYEIGFPKPDDVGLDYNRWMKKFRPMFVPARIAIQRALEDSLFLKAQHQNRRGLILDRMIADSATYFRSAEEFLEQAQMTKQEVLQRYDCIIFLESLLFRSDLSQSYNRRMPAALAKRSQRRLLEVYQDHPHFYFVRARQNLNDKIAEVRAIIRQVLELQ